MKTATPTHLKRVVDFLGVTIPSFRWTFYDLRDPEITCLLDPPCHIIRGRFGPFTLDLHADGEWTANRKFGKGQIDMTMPPSKIAVAFLALIRGD